MTVDVTKLNFYSGYPIDKIVATGTVSVSNDGSTTDPQSAKIVTATRTNTYGKQCFVRAVYSTDGINFNPISSHLVYTFNYNATYIPDTFIMSGLKAAVSVGVSNTTIYFRTANGLHGDVTDDGVSVTYSPTAQTFTIKYALYEKE